MDSFANKVVIVTGASYGLGQALALRLADEGACLTLAARSVERLEALAEKCERRGAHALVVPTDVSDGAQCQQLVERTRAHYGRIDMLINNAGVGVFGKLEEFPDLHLLKQVMAVNFYGAASSTYFALPHLKAARGRIVNISSLGGKFALPFNTPYCSSKFALMGFSDALRLELSDSGVSVTVVCPYWVVTEFHEHETDQHGQARGSQGRSVYTDKMMTADRCAQITLEAARRRRREVVMGPGFLAGWLKLISPALLDRLIVATVLRPAVERLSGSTAIERSSGDAYSSRFRPLSHGYRDRTARRSVGGARRD